MPNWPAESRDFKTFSKKKGAAAKTRPPPFSWKSGLSGGYSMTWMFFFAHISLRTFGHTVTLTSPR